jgi:exodeoxyribonuclease V gamma subunit
MRRLRPGGLRLGHKLPWWLAYLAVVASGHEIGLRLAGTRDGNARQLAGQIDAETARAYLQAAVEHYRDGHTRPLLFEGYVGEHYLDQRAKTSETTGAPKPPAEALKSTNGWLSNTWQPPHPVRDPWLAPVFGPSPEPLGTGVDDSSFVQLTEAVAYPLQQHLEQVER